jgi:acylpyruvate hydrolase
MKLVTIDSVRGGEPGALLPSGEVLALRRAAQADSLEIWLPDSLRDLLAGGPAALALVRALVERVLADPGLQDGLRQRGALMPPGTRLLAPVPNPSLVVAAGLAYKSHLAEMAGTPTPRQPTGFIKVPASIVGPDHAVALPADAPAHVDYEGELAVVFGRRCHRVGADQAMDCVAGYTVANDISARDWVRDVWGATQPWEARQTWEVNIMGKQFEGFTPLGPVLLTADEVPDVGRLHITTHLNSELMQSSPVSDLIFSLPETIAYFSRWYCFNAGDVLLTGTPAGVGAGRKPQVFMKAGDVIEVAISCIGTLRNTLVAAT